MGTARIVGPFFLPLPAFTRIFFHALLQGRDDRGQQLQDNLGGNVRINTHRQTEKLETVPPESRSSRSNQRACCATTDAKHGLDDVGISPRHGHMRRQAVDRQDEQR